MRGGEGGQRGTKKTVAVHGGNPEEPEPQVCNYCTFDSKNPSLNLSRDLEKFDYIHIHVTVT